MTSHQLAAGRAEIELADVLALFVQLRVVVRDAEGGEAVEDAELFLAQALVGFDDDPAALEALHQDVGGLGGAHIGRVQHHGRLLLGRQGGKPGTEGLRLALAQLGQGHVDVAMGDIDAVSGGSFGEVTRNVAGALTMPDQPDFLRPLLFHHQPVFDIDMTAS